MGDMTEPTPETRHTGKAGTEHGREHCRPVWCGEFPAEGHPLAATPEEREMLARGADPVQVYSGQYPGSRARPASRSGTWGAPSLPSGRDDFRARQQPDPRPVDDLSRFVLDRIQFTENGPRHEVPQVYDQPAGPVAHRYAAEMRADMVAFRRIVAAYCDVVDMGEPFELADAISALGDAVKSIAMRFAEHPDFKPEWRLE
jgi:hypothetical protein